jgi:CheY-like chemotaxis protein
VRQKANEKYTVLIADDSEENSFFMERALRQSRRFHVIGSVRNEEEAVLYLSGQGVYADRQLWPFPDVLLMDLKMPQHDGPKISAWLQQHPCPDLRAVNLLGSRIQAEIETIKLLGADAFHPQTPQNARLLELVAKLEDFLLLAGRDNVS